MSQTHLDHFGEVLMTEVRDYALGHWQNILRSRMTSRKSELALQNLSSDEKAIFELVIPEVVDVTMHYLLGAIDGNASTLRIAVSDGSTWVENISAVSEELPAELYGPSGWISRFAQIANENP